MRIERSVISTMKIWKNTNTLDALIPSLAKDLVDPAEAELVVIGSKPIDLELMPQLKGLFKCGVGTDNVPFEACAEKGIRVGLPSEATASIIFEETASFANYLVLKMLYSEIGDVECWKKTSRVFAGKKKVLILGMGNIGRRVAAKLKSTVQVLSYDSADPGRESLESLLPQADVVSLHLPLTEETRGMVDKAMLSLMKDRAALVNTARGPIVDEGALFEELSSGRIRAAFDVFWQEPYRGRLKSLYPEPFYMTPHVASNCHDFLEGLAKDYLAFASEF